MNFKGKTYFLFPFNIQFVECIDHMVDGGKTQEKRKKDGVRLSVRSIFGRDILIETQNGVTFFLRE